MKVEILMWIATGANILGFFHCQYRYLSMKRELEIIIKENEKITRDFK